MSGALRLLAAVFDIETGAASTKLKALDKSLGTAKEALTTLAASVVGAFSLHEISDFFKSQIELGDALVDTATKLGVGADELQRFQYGAGLAGVNAESAATALGFLNKNFGEALAGGGEAAKTFAQLGIALRDADGSVRETGDLIPELADGFAKMGSQQERTAAAMKLFGRSGASLLPFLQQGSEGVAKLNEEFEALGGGLNGDFLRGADKAGDEIFRLKTAFTGLKSRIALEALPAVTEFLVKLQGLTARAIRFTKETHIVKEALAALGVVGSVAALRTAMSWAKVFGLFTGKGGVIKGILSMGWVGLAIAAIAALALVVEDLFVMFEGGESVIGDWLDEVFGIGTAAKYVEDFKGILQNLQNIFVGLTPITEALSSLFKDMFGIPLPSLKEFLGLLGGTYVDYLKTMTKAALQFEGVIGAIIEKTGELIDKVGPLADLIPGLGSGFKETGAKMQALSRMAVNGPPKPSAEDNALRITQEYKPFYMYEPPSPRVRPSAGEARGDTTVSQRNDINITVNGGNTNADTGKAVAKAVREPLDNSLQQAKAAL